MVLSAFMFFMKEGRARITAECGFSKLRSVGKKCGEEWAALDAMKRRKKYDDMHAAEDRKRHIKKVKN